MKRKGESVKVWVVGGDEIGRQRESVVERGAEKSKEHRKREGDE